MFLFVYGIGHWDLGPVMLAVDLLPSFILNKNCGWGQAMDDGALGSSFCSAFYNNFGQRESHGPRFQCRRPAARNVATLQHSS